jgi:hypothetical protein
MFFDNSMELKNLHSVTAERDAVTAERDAVTAERDHILASKSWKMTKPLRKLASILKLLKSNYRTQGISKREIDKLTGK